MTRKCLEDSMLIVIAFCWVTFVGALTCNGLIHSNGLTPLITMTVMWSIMTVSFIVWVMARYGKNC